MNCVVQLQPNHGPIPMATRTVNSTRTSATSYCRVYLCHALLQLPKSLERVSHRHQCQKVYNLAGGVAEEFVSLRLTRGYCTVKSVVHHKVAGWHMFRHEIRVSAPCLRNVAIQDNREGGIFWSLHHSCVSCVCQ